MATILLPGQVCPVECVDHVSADSKTVWSFRRSFPQHKGFKRQLGDTQVKRCIDVSLSISRPPKSTCVTKPPARTSLISAFGACKVSSSYADIEVLTAQFCINIYIFLCVKYFICIKICKNSVKYLHGIC